MTKKAGNIFHVELRSLNLKEIGCLLNLKQTCAWQIHFPSAGFVSSEQRSASVLLSSVVAVELLVVVAKVVDV